ncbi:MAG: CvpA family protein [Alphaproteobacteria bacterium]|nr:CvpA family protein [Alphaproteobacteria bacterium]
MPFNNVDYFILFLSFFSIYTAGKNGLLAEFIGGVSMVLALSITYIFGSRIEEKIMEVIGVKFISMIFSYAVIFIVLLSLLYYIMNLIVPKHFVKTSTDRILGALFGAFKFFVLFLIFVYVLNLLFPIYSQPDILRESYLKTLADNILSSGIMQYLQDIIK